MPDLSLPSTPDDPSAKPTQWAAELQRVDRYLNAAPLVAAEAVVCGPFTLFLNRETDQPYASYARPTTPLPPNLNDLVTAIHAVRDEFTRRGRVCRWEFLMDLWPDLPHALVRAGFPTPDRHPLMLVTPALFRPETARPEFQVRPLAPKEDPRPLLEVAHAAFQMGDRPLEDAEVQNLRGMIAGGLRIFGAWRDGRAVGTAAHLPVGDTTEVNGVATLPEFQGRGIGGATTSAVVQDAFATGCRCVFLTAGDALACRLYTRLGFHEVAVGMSVADEPPDGASTEEAN
jgi:ribosomal protein S18 acetylase RimI-like enzyme